MTKRAKKRLFSILRIAVCVGALAIVLRGVTLDDHIELADGKGELTGRLLEIGDTVTIVLHSGDVRHVARDRIAVDQDGAPRIMHGLKSVWRLSRKKLLLLAVAIHSIVVVLQGVRLRWMLRAQRISLSAWECVKLSLAGNFLNFATPLGSNAGDVFKAYFVSLHTDRKTEAVTTIVLDRIVGLGSLLLVVTGITAFCVGDSRLSQFRPYLLGMMGLGVVGGALYLSPFVRRHLVPWGWLTRLAFFDQLRRIDRTARTLVKHRAILLASILITVALQAFAMGAYFTVAVALRFDAHAGNILEYYAYFASGAVIQALPGPPQGLGTVELAYRYFLAAYGTPSQIVSLAFAVRLVVLICALPGLLITLTGSYKPKGAEWRAAVEHDLARDVAARAGAIPDDDRAVR